MPAALRCALVPASQGRSLIPTTHHCHATPPPTAKQGRRVVVNLNDLREFDMELARCVLGVVVGLLEWAGEDWSLPLIALRGCVCAPPRCLG